MSAAGGPGPTAGAGARIRVAILAALRQEIDAFRRAHDLDPAPMEQWGTQPEEARFPAYRFSLGRVDVTLMRSGVGKVMAAMGAQHLLDRTRPDYLIVTGIAGSVRPELDLGDVVVSRDCVQHDLDATALGFALGQVPDTDYRFLRADEKLVALALATPVPGQRVVAGRILTGDQFIQDPAPTQRDRLRALGGIVVEMEGAAIALVATVNRVPFVIIRSVSDRADASAPADFGAYLRRAAANSRTVCAGILEGLEGLERPEGRAG